MFLGNAGSKQTTDASDHHTLAFGAFTIDLDRGTLLHKGNELSLRPKSFAVLAYLARHQGVLVAKDELMQAIWGEVVVTEDSLTQCLIEIRKALGDSSKTMIRTVPRRGFLFEMPVEIRGPGDQAQVTASQKTLFSYRKPSVWSAVAIIILSVAMVAAWWNVTTDSRPDDRVSEAEQFYLEGRFFHERRGEEDLDRAIQRYEQALAIDPGLADAWVGLAGSISVQAYYRDGNWDAVLGDYLEYLNRALQLDPNHPEAHIRLADYNLYSGKSDLAQHHYDQAMKYGQDSSLVLSVSASYLQKELRIDEAIAQQKRAVILDPLGYVNRGNLAYMLKSAGQYREAKKEYLIAMDLNIQPTQMTLINMSDLHLLLGEPALAEEVALLLTDARSRDRALAMINEATGRTEEAVEFAKKLASLNDVKSALYLSEIHAFHGSTDEAFHWLSIASDRQLKVEDAFENFQLLFDASASSFLLGLRDDARWDAWVQNVESQAWEQPITIISQNSR